MKAPSICIALFSIALVSSPPAADAAVLIVNNGVTNNHATVSTYDDVTVNTGGTLNLTGGALTHVQTSGPNNGTGSFGGWTVNGDVTVSGGTHVFNERLYGSGTFQVIGSTSSISMHQIGAPTIAWDFIFDSTGVTTITGAGGFPWFALSNSTLNVDASALTTPGTYQLFNGHSAGSFFPSINATPPSGWVASTQQFESGGRDIIQITIAIPEPSLTGLLSFGFMAILLRRRR